MIPTRFVLLAVPFLLAAAPDGIPELDVAATCHARDATGTAAQGCMRDEIAAKDELRKTWTNISASLRESCLGEVRIGGSPSYVELLTCFQMDQWSRQPSPGDRPAASRAGGAPAPAR